MAPTVRVAMELSWSLWTWAYAPNSMQQCLLKSMPLQVTMLRGLRVADTPSGWGKAFSQKLQSYIILMIMRAGIFLNGRVLYMALARSLRVLMYRSISGT
jgi:hypothetical protein